jgi:hypothetical protein
VATPVAEDSRPGGTLITFHHLALGLFSEEHRAGVDRGWSHIHAQVRARAERR